MKLLARILPMNRNEDDYDQIPTANAIELTNNNNINTPSSQYANNTTIFAEPFHGTIAIPVDNNNTSNVPVQIVDAQPAGYAENNSNNNNNNNNISDDVNATPLPFFLPIQTNPSNQSYPSTRAQRIIARIRINRGSINSSRARSERSGMFFAYYKMQLQNLPLGTRLCLYFMGGCLAFCICVTVISAIVALSVGSLSQSGGYINTVYFLDSHCSSKYALYQLGSPTQTCFIYGNSSAQYLNYATNTSFLVYEDNNCAGAVVSLQTIVYNECQLDPVVGLYQSSFYDAVGYSSVINSQAFDNSGYADSECKYLTQRMTISLDTCIPTSIHSSVIYKVTNEGYQMTTFGDNQVCTYDGVLVVNRVIHSGCVLVIVDEERTIAPYHQYEINDECS